MGRRRGSRRPEVSPYRWPDDGAGRSASLGGAEDHYRVRSARVPIREPSPRRGADRPFARAPEQGNGKAERHQQPQHRPEAPQSRGSVPAPLSPKKRRPATLAPAAQSRCRRAATARPQRATLSRGAQAARSVARRRQPQARKEPAERPGIVQTVRLDMLEQNTGRRGDETNRSAGHSTRREDVPGRGSGPIPSARSSKRTRRRRRPRRR